MATKLTTEEFIQRARLVHGARYDYSCVEYRASNEKVEIICPDHGAFKQKASHHISRHGCPHCGRAITLAACADVHSRYDFVAKAREKHGNKYDYSNTIYVDAASKIDIICPEHGLFSQWPSHHLNSVHGCPKCADTAVSSKNILSLNTLFDRCRDAHGSKYDYSKVVYRGKRHDIEIICSEHGSFFQRPDVHSKGSGCPTCSYAVGNEKKTLTQNEFLERCEAVHADTYDYSHVVYKKWHEVVTIICREHGAFDQRAGQHAAGSGCPQCAQRLISNTLQVSDPNTPSFLYILDLSHGAEMFFKLGISVDISSRLASIRRSAYDVGVIELFHGTRQACFDIEQELLCELRKTHRHDPEYGFSGQRECLSTNPLDLPGIRDRILAAGLKPVEAPTAKAA